MYSLLFRSRWFALACVFLVIFSVVAFFAKGGGQETLETAASDIRASDGATLGPGLSGTVDPHYSSGFAGDTPGTDSTTRDNPELETLVTEEAGPDLGE